MEAMIIFGMLMLFLFGGMALALGAAYASTERARQMEEEARRGQMARTTQAIPGFFVMPGRGERPLDMPGFDEALVARLESHVREEQALVSDFVHHPSVNSLYRQGPRVMRPN